MIELRYFVVYQLHIESTDLESKSDTLSPNIQDCSFIFDTSEPPVLVGIVHASRLKESDRRKLGSGEVDLTRILFVFSFLGYLADEVRAPGLGLAVPNSDFEGGGVFADVDLLRNLENDLNGRVNQVH